MSNKEIYETPEVTVEKHESIDILTDSTGNNTGNNTGGLEYGDTGSIEP